MRESSTFATDAMTFSLHCISVIGRCPLVLRIVLSMSIAWPSSGMKDVVNESGRLGGREPPSAISSAAATKGAEAQKHYGSPFAQRAGRGIRPAFDAFLVLAYQRRE